jgi:hypothetical protein
VAEDKASNGVGECVDRPPLLEIGVRPHLTVYQRVQTTTEPQPLPRSNCIGIEMVDV